MATTNLTWNSEEVPVGSSRELEVTVRLSLQAKAAITLVYGVLFVCGVLGNALVIQVIWKMRGRSLIQASVSHHLYSLACSDLLVLLVGIPTELYTIIWCPYPGPGGNVGCKGFYLLWEVSSYATVFNILAFSCERYLVTCHPLKVKLMPSSRTRRLVGLVWAMAVFSSLPTLFTVGMEDAFLPFHQTGLPRREPFLICTNRLAQEKLFAIMVFMSFGLYVLVLLAVSITCRRMMQALQRSRTGSITLQSSSGVIQVMGKCRRRGRTCIRRQNVLMLGCIVGALAVCWVPFQARRLMTAVRSKGQWTEGYYRFYITLQPITNSFYYFSSSINPLLYNLTSMQFRRAFRRHLRLCANTQSTLHTPSSSLRQQVSLDLQLNSQQQQEPVHLQSNPMQQNDNSVELNYLEWQELLATQTNSLQKRQQPDLELKCLQRQETLEL